MEKIQLGHHIKGYKYKYPKMYAIVDDEDYERLNTVKWSAYFNRYTKTFYARRCVEINGRITTEWMARAVLNAPKGMLADHINHDTLDNRKCNLRLATQSENQMNRGATRASSTGCKGVYFNKKTGKYFVRLTIAGKQIHFGCAYETLQEAKTAYEQAIQKYHGEFAHFGGKK